LLAVKARRLVLPEEIDERRSTARDDSLAADVDL
jgi:hypothetical protein